MLESLGPGAVVPQTYHQTPVPRRGLDDVSYAPFVPIATLDAAGGTAPIRISTVWEVIEAGDLAAGSSSAYECSAVGENILVQSADGLSYVATTGGFCAADHIVVGSAGAARYAAIRAITTRAVAFYFAALRVRPVLDANITLDAATVLGSFPSLNVSAVADTDLVIIMTARPSPNRPLTGYATCLQRDQFQRCTVGWFNWVPELINVATPDSPDVVASELHTALHEMVHVLGGVGPAFTAVQSPFIDDNGVTRPMSDVYTVGVDPAYANKPMTFIITPRVAAIARAAFGCSAMPGFPLEDLELGKGVHWEARLAGPELMSYGTGSGLVFFSDLTFAFLEDTNQYIANYSMAGPLTSSTATDYIVEPLSFLTPQNLGPPNSSAPGTLSWGRGEGCAFVNGSARTWPTEYTCATQNQYGCTPDHLMSAACVLKSTYTSEPSCASYGNFVDGMGPTCGVQNTLCSDGACEITPLLQFFSSDGQAATAAGSTSATAANTGGFSDALDYVPVYVGYWSCMDVVAQATTGVAGGETGFSLSSISSSFGSSSVSSIGGQSHGPTSRCLQSTLQALQFSSGASYGLCYTTNCFKPDYLQVGVRGVLGGNSVYWYRCPSGGALRIPGFAGSISCPDTRKWCSIETITGIRYTEENVVWEYVIWSIVGVILVFLGVLACCPECTVGQLKRCCCVRVFDPKRTARDEAIADAEEDAKYEAARSAATCCCRIMCPRGKLAWAFCSINTVWLLFAILVLLFAIAAIAIAKAVTVSIALLRVGLLLFVVAVTGVNGSCGIARRGPSCWILSYMLLGLMQLLFYLWIVAYVLGLGGWADFVPQAILELGSYWPFSYDANFVTNNRGSVAVVAAIVLLLVLLTFIAAGFLVRPPRVLYAVFIASLSHVFLFAGLALAGAGVYLKVAEGSMQQLITDRLAEAAISAGVAMIVICFIALCAVGFKSRFGVVLYILVMIVSSCLLAWVCAACAGDSIADFVEAQPSADFDSLANILGIQTTKSAFLSQPRNILRQGAVACGLFIFVNLLLIAAAIALFVEFYKDAGEERHAAQGPATVAPVVAGGHVAVGVTAPSLMQQPWYPPPQVQHQPHPPQHQPLHDQHWQQQLPVQQPAPQQRPGSSSGFLPQNPLWHPSAAPSHDASVRVSTADAPSYRPTTASIIAGRATTPGALAVSVAEPESPGRRREDPSRVPMDPVAENDEDGGGGGGGGFSRQTSENVQVLPTSPGQPQTAAESWGWGAGSGASAKQATPEPSTQEPLSRERTAPVPGVVESVTPSAPSAASAVPPPSSARSASGRPGTSPKRSSASGADAERSNGVALDKLSATSTSGAPQAAAAVGDDNAADLPGTVPAAEPTALTFPSAPAGSTSARNGASPPQPSED